MTIELHRPPETSVDLVGPDAVRDPHAVFATLRADSDVWWLQRHKAWLLLGYELIKDAVAHEQLSTDTITPLQRHLSAEDRARFKPAADLLAGWMIFNDPPVHTALRDPVRRAFTPRSISRLEGEIGALVDRLCDDVDPNGFDLVNDIAYPLPATVIALLLGAPAKSHGDFKDWSKYLGALVMGKVSRADAWDRALIAAEDMGALFRAMIDTSRREPTDDLVGALVNATGEQGTLTDEQVVGACSLLLFGGHETTTSLLTSGVFHLIGDEDRQQQLHANPAQAVEELLRYDGPSKIVVRRARYSEEWNGFPFEANQPVFCALMAGNRDPTVFDAPDQLRLDRNPNRHLGFGWGLHFCLGANLARLEARVVLPRVFARFPDLALAVPKSELRWQPTVVGRTLRSLPVRVGSA